MLTAARLQKFRLLLDANPLPMVLLDVESGKVEAANDLFHELRVGVKSSQKFPSTFQIGLWKTEEERRNLVQQCRTEGTLTFEHALEQESSSPRSFLVTLRSLEPFGEPGLLAVVLGSLGEMEELRKRTRDLEGLKQILETSSSDVIARIDLSGNRLYTSPSVQHLSGWTAQELVGTTPFQQFHPDDVPMLREIFARLIATGRPETPTYRTRHKSGDYLWVETNCVPIRDATGKVVEIHTSTRNVTARQNAETSLRRSEAFHRELVANLSEGLLLLNQKGQVYLSNGRAHEILHVPDGSLIGADMFSGDWLFFDEQGKPLPATSLPGALTLRDQKTRRDVEVGVSTPAGTVWISQNSSIIAHNEGESGFTLLVSFTDVTRRREARIALREREERLQLVLDATSDGLWDWDISSGEVFTNNAWFRILGHEPGDFPASFNGWRERVHPDDLPLAEKQIIQHLSGKATEPYSVEFRMRGADGTWHWILSRGQVVRRDEKGMAVRMVGTHTDITDRKTAEERYKALFENLSSAFALHEIIVDKDGKPVDYRFLEVNAAFESLTGLKEEDILGRTVLELMPGTESYWIETYGAVALTGKPARIENHSRELGRSFDVRAYSPAPGQFAVIFIDVTEQHRVLLDLRESESRLRTIADQSRDLVSRHGLDGSFTWVSRAVTDLLGIDAPQVLGTRFLDYVDPLDLPVAQQAMTTLAEDGEVRFQCRLLQPSGGSLWVDASGLLLRDPETDQAVELHFTTRDIDSQMQRSELLETTQRLARLGGWEILMPSREMLWTQLHHEIFGSDPSRSPPGIDEIIGLLDSDSGIRYRSAIDDLLTRGTAFDIVVGGKSMQGRTLVLRLAGEATQRNGVVVHARGTTQDITEQESVRRQFEAISRLNSTILDTSEALIILLDREGHIARFNQACVRTTGWREEEVIGRPFFDLLLPPQERETVRSIFYSLLKGSFPSHFKNNWIDRDGRLIWITWANSVILDDRGEVLYIVGTGIDMTSHRATQIELLESEQRWRTLIEAAPEAIVLLDPKTGCFREANPSAEKLYGRSRAELLGLGPLDVSPPVQPSGVPSAEAAMEQISAALEGSSPNFEWIHRRSDGSDIHCQINLCRIPSPDGFLVRGSIIDISRKKKTETVMESLVKGTSSLFGQEFFDALVKDLALLLDVRYAFIGKSTSAGSIRSLSFHSDGKPAPNFEYGLEGSPCKDVYAKNLLFVREDIRNFYPHSSLLENLEAVSYMGVPLHNSSQEPIGILVVIDSKPMVDSELARDILTIFAGRAQGEIERLEGEEALRNLNTTLEKRVGDRTAQLSASNRELESFAYSVSHDLRSPLRSIDGFAQALEEDYHDLLDVDGKHFLERIRSASHRMSDLIDDLLTLSRSSRAALRKRQVDLSAAALEIKDSLSRSQPDRQVVWQIQSDLVALADPVLIHSVLENLLENAWKYSSQRTKAVISLERIPSTDDCDWFEVTDNGAGFDMQHAQKLFGTFQRLHAADEFEGNGIGLATVRRIIERHGGNISAFGEPGIGASLNLSWGKPI
ncbi:MAG: PAS domain S-box protein [Fibrobacteria bacterium]|nr:PAS domain S-box protein [Fibrobacteria bacterium]